MVKKLQDPNAPKRPMSGYFMWMASGVRDKLISEKKGGRVAEIMKICGQRWSEMPEKEKNVWQDKSKRAKEAWTKKMTAYKKTASFKKFQARKSENDLMKVKKAKKPKDKNAPKRPLSGFFLFTREFRKANPLLKLTEVTKNAGVEWKALDEGKKKKYLHEADKAKAKYQKELAKYKKSNKYAKYQEELTAFKKQQKMKLKKMNKNSKN